MCKFQRPGDLAAFSKDPTNQAGPFLSHSPTMTPKGMILGLKTGPLAEAGFGQRRPAQPRAPRGGHRSADSEGEGSHPLPSGTRFGCRLSCWFPQKNPPTTGYSQKRRTLFSFVSSFSGKLCGLWTPLLVSCLSLWDMSKHQTQV